MSICERLVYLAAAWAVVVGVANLFGWEYHFEPALAVYPGLPRMVPHTALGVIAAGLALPLAASHRLFARKAGKMLALLLLAFCTLTLLEYAGGWDFGIDRLLFAGARMIPAAPPGRPGLYTPVALAAVALALLLIDRQIRGVRPAELLALIAVLTGTQVLAGYVYGAESLYVRPGTTAMSLLASLCALVLGLGVLWSRPATGLMSVVMSDRLGGHVARRLLSAFLALLLLGLLIMGGHRGGLYGKSVACVLLAMCALAIVVPILLAVSNRLNQLDTERERHERELERWRLYFAQATWGALVVNSAGNLLAANRAFAEMNGASPEQLAGRSLFSVLAPTRPEELRARLTAAVERGRHRFEWQDELRGGPAGRVLLVDVTVIQDGTGRLLHYALYVEDITAQKRSQLERERLLASERKANERALLLSESSAVLARSLDQEAALPSLAHLLVPRLADGCVIYLRDELLHASRVAAVAHVDPAKERLLGAACLDSPEPAHRPQSLLSVPFIAHAHVLGGMALAYSDSNRRYEPGDRTLAVQIAGRASSAIENARLYREAVSAARARDDIIAVISHDLRNPLTAIDLSAHFLARGEAGATPRVRLIGTIEKAVKRMAALIDDLLTASASEGGSLTVERKPCPLPEVVQETLEVMEPLAAARSTHIETDVPPSLTALCDRQRTIQVISNLVSNSVKFGQPGSAVHLSARAVGDEIRIGVSDSGPGIAERDLPHVFDRFWKGHVSGTGLGLYIAKCLVEAQGGTIWVQSKAGEGSTFFFTLPASDRATEARALPC
jgi:PAS domain S-box-containing protein